MTLHRGVCSRRGDYRVGSEAKDALAFIHTSILVGNKTFTVFAPTIGSIIHGPIKFSTSLAFMPKEKFVHGLTGFLRQVVSVSQVRVIVSQSRVSPVPSPPLNTITNDTDHPYCSLQHLQHLQLVLIDSICCGVQSNRQRIGLRRRAYCPGWPAVSVSPKVCLPATPIGVRRRSLDSLFFPRSTNRRI